MTRNSTICRKLCFLLLPLAYACGPSVQNTQQADEVLLNIRHEELSTLGLPPPTDRLGAVGSFNYSQINSLPDLSSAARANTHSRRIEFVEQLEALLLQAPPREDLASVMALLESYDHYLDLAAFGHGDVTPNEASPYAIASGNNAWLTASEFLNQGSIETLADAQAYISLLQDLPRFLRDDRMQLIGEANAQLIPPSLVLEDALLELENQLEIKTEDTAFLLNLTDGLALLESGDADAEASLLEQARRIYDGPVRAEMEALAVTLRNLIDEAPETLGLAQYDHGEEWYRASLKLVGASGDQTAERLLDETLTSINTLNSQIDALLLVLGREEDTFSQRLTALLESAERADLAKTAEDRRRLETDLSSVQELMRRRLVRLFAFMPGEAPEVAMGRAQAEDLQVSPNWQTLSFNHQLHSIRVDQSQLPQTPALLLPAQLYQAGYPGAALMDELVRISDLSPLDLMFHQAGFDRGWQLYALTLTQELNAYDAAPSALLGAYLIERYEAAKLYVDISLHLRGWSSEEAIAFLQVNSSFPEAALRNDLQNMASHPGRSGAAFIGHQRLIDLRERARTLLGDEFSLPEFHALILSSGSRPLDALEAETERWIQTKMGEKSFQ